MKRPTIRMLLASVLALVVLADVGLVIFRRQTPVTLPRALERFRQIDDGAPAGARTVGVARDDGAESVADPTTGPRADRTPSHAGTATNSVVVAIPAEGVYLYEGSGEEGFGPVTRAFPPASWRLVTHNGPGSWLEHHIFSEERQAWTHLSTTAGTRTVRSQRNFIKIGPYTQDKDLPFDPPIVSAHLPPRVGRAWSGAFSGESSDGEQYHGTYTGRTTEERVFRVGGTDVLTWGVALAIWIEGEIRGTVRVTRWFSPSLGLNVREDYLADVDLAGGLTYHASWSVVLRSVRPRT